MKPIEPQTQLDDLIAAALDHQLTPEERAQFEARLQTDPAARAAYEEAKHMHSLLEGTYTGIRPDPAFEQRMVSGVRRRINQKQHSETPWESVLFLWRAVKLTPRKIQIPRLAFNLVVIGFIIMILLGVALGPITGGIEKAKESAAMQMQRQQQLEQQEQVADSSQAASSIAKADADSGQINRGVSHVVFPSSDQTAALPGFSSGKQEGMPSSLGAIKAPILMTAQGQAEAAAAPDATADSGLPEPPVVTRSGEQGVVEAVRVFPNPINAPSSWDKNVALEQARSDTAQNALSQPQSPGAPKHDVTKGSANGNNAPAVEDLARKLIRNADLELEVKSFQTAIDGITSLAKTAGGYVDSSNSQRGGNGKLQGQIIIKVLPANLDDVLLKLRELGDVRNQSVKTDDVTKDYYDTQARLDNSRKTEAQLQELLKRNNGKVSDLLEVERELGRVRGEIEQMEGSLRFYDFLVQYATITIQLKEKDLNQAAAYLLQEQDNFSLFATDVEDTFKKARQAAEDCKAQVLNATLTHNSGSDVSAELIVMVPPDQIETFLTQVRALGRIADFTRQSQRVAKDGGDSDHPADQTLTEKDKVQVHLSIRSDDESRKQVALVVVTSTVDAALDQAKTTALANAGTEILGSSLNRTDQGQSSGQLRVRVPGKSYDSLLTAFRALGRTASFSLQREDNSGPGANGDEAPVIVSLALTDTDTPLQQTDLSVIASQVDDQAQQLKKQALAAGVEIKASNFSRQPDGREVAQMTFRLPLSKYPAFVEILKQSGKVESLAVNRSDRPDQARTDDTAPAEINLVLHNQGDIIADDHGLWATLRETFGEGVGALFSSIRTIGVLIAFVAPWLLTISILAWIARRLYLWKKK